MKRIMGTNTVGATDGTWAQAVSKGQMLFISGQIGCDATGEPVGLDFASQARKALDNLFLLLETCAGTAQDLVSITVFLKNMEDRPEFARIRKKYFEGNPPASTVVQICELCDPRLLIEINGIAVLDGKD